MEAGLGSDLPVLALNPPVWPFLLLEFVLINCSADHQAGSASGWLFVEVAAMLWALLSSRGEPGGVGDSSVGITDTSPLPSVGLLPIQLWGWLRVGIAEQGVSLGVHLPSSTVHPLAAGQSWKEQGMALGNLHYLSVPQFPHHCNSFSV